MSDGHIYLIRFGGQARASSFLIFIFTLFAFPPAGEVDKIALPEGMQSVDFRDCSGLTGTAGLEDEMVIFI